MSRHPSSDGYSQASDWLIGTVKRNPEGFLLLAAGCALMLRTGRSSSGPERNVDSGPTFREQRGAMHATYHPSSEGSGSSVGEKFSQAAREATDYRFCPFCKRRLLALGSPACNYCGRALPEDFVKARDALWQRINEVGAGRASDDEIEELERESDDAMRRALKSLLDLGNRKRDK